ncbi:hypothetical protein V6N13_056928 [Hibiscus sabdariffa]
MDNGNLLSTVLTYKEADLVPVPISVAPSVTERDVESRGVLLPRQEGRAVAVRCGQFWGTVRLSWDERTISLLTCRASLSGIAKPIRMRIISWNVRGLGGAAKRRGLRDVLRKQQCDMVFLLESKLEVVSQFLVSGLWLNDGFEFVFAPSVGAPGGILVIWNSLRFWLELSEVLSHFLVVKGFWVQDDFSRGLVAVYTPCGTLEQRALWEALGQGPGFDGFAAMG